MPEHATGNPHNPSTSTILACRNNGNSLDGQPTSVSHTALEGESLPDPGGLITNVVLEGAWIDVLGCGDVPEHELDSRDQQHRIQFRRPLRHRELRQHQPRAHFAVSSPARAALNLA